MNDIIILIAGPTASGKSALAVFLAEKIGGIVINADSMQVYRELRVLTARPSKDDESRAPHALYGHIPSTHAYSAAQYAHDVRDIIVSSRARGLVPIVTGGTGLYFKTLLEGLSPVPKIPEDVRQHWRQKQGTLSAEELHRELSTLDPVMASRLHISDKQRVTRALEVIEATGTSLAEWQNEPGIPVIRDEDCHKIKLQPERSELHRRCDARFDQMIEQGAVDEVRALAAQGLDPGLPAMRALGVQPLLRYLRGEIDLASAAAAGKAETRQYVKRQQTWMKRNMMSWNEFSTQEKDVLSHEVLNFIRR